MPDREPDQEAGDDRAPEAADAAEHDDREGGITASTPTWGRRPQIGVRMMPATRRERGAEREHEEAQTADVDAERAHHLAVVRAGFDARAVRRPLEEEPHEPMSTMPTSREEAVLGVHELARP